MMMNMGHVFVQRLLPLSLQWSQWTVPDSECGRLAGRQVKTEVIICSPYVGHKISADQIKREVNTISLTGKACLPHPSLRVELVPDHDYIIV